MPLSMLELGVTRNIIRVGGAEKTKRFLNSLGFIEGASVTIVSKLAGNIIINVMDTRIAIDKVMAAKIFV